MDGARPVYRGLGRGGAAGGIPCGAPLLFSPYRSAEGPPGPFSMPRAPEIERCIPWPPVCGPGGATHIGSGGRTAPSPRRALLSRGPSCRHPARASLPAPGRAGRTGPRGASCGHREGPAVQLPGAGPASMSPSRLKRNRRVIPRAPAPLREWACGPSRHRSFERSSTWRLTCGLHAFSGARRGHGALPAIQICVQDVETDIPGPEGPPLWHH